MNADRDEFIVPAGRRGKWRAVGDRVRCSRGGQSPSRARRPLDRSASGFDGFDRFRDRVWTAEATEESTHVWTHNARIAAFFAVKRHFRDRLRTEGMEVDYRSHGREGVCCGGGCLPSGDVVGSRPWHTIICHSGERCR